MKTSAGLLFIGIVLSVPSCFGITSNLLPNGDVENEFLNLLTEEGGYATHIQAKDTSVPTYWKLTPGAEMSKDVKHQGGACIRLQGGKKTVSATVFSGYWRVKDASMPFGLPLVPGREVRVSFYYKTSPIAGGTVPKAESSSERLPICLPTLRRSRCLKPRIGNGSGFP